MYTFIGKVNAWTMEKIISIEVLFLSIDIFVSLVLSSRQILLTQLSQATNMLLISNKISINKNKQIDFFCYFFIFLYWCFIWENRDYKCLSTAIILTPGIGPPNSSRTIPRTVWHPFSPPLETLMDRFALFVTLM